MVVLCTAVQVQDRVAAAHGAQRLTPLNEVTTVQIVIAIAHCSAVQVQMEQAS